MIPEILCLATKAQGAQRVFHKKTCFFLYTFAVNNHTIGGGAARLFFYMEQWSV